MIIVELKVIPLGTKSASVSSFVAKAVGALKEAGIKPELTAMGTVFETESMEKALEGIKKAHQAVFSEGADRVVTLAEIDERRDKAGGISQKIESVQKKVSE